MTFSNIIYSFDFANIAEAIFCSLVNGTEDFFLRPSSAFFLNRVDSLPFRGGIDFIAIAIGFGF